MMIAYSAAQNVWQRAAIGWGVGLFVLGVDLLFILDFLETQVLSLPVFILIWLGGVALFWALGKVIGECDRVLIYVAIMGAFGVLPIILALTFTSLLSIIALMCKLESMRYALGMFLVAYIIGVIIEIFHVRRNILSSGFFEKELRVEGSKIIISRLPKVNPYVSTMSTGSIRRVSNGVISLLPLLAFGAYSVQNIIAVNFGGIGVFFLLSAVGLPYTYHCIGRFFGGLFLWLYMIHRIEVRYGKIAYFKSVAP